MYCDNPANEKRIWTWLDCSFEERVRNWELPTKWYKSINEIKNVFGDILFQFPKSESDSMKIIKDELIALFNKYNLQPIIYNDYGLDCILFWYEKSEYIKEDCETRLLSDEDFYYSPLGQLSLADYKNALNHLESVLEINYTLTPKYIAERFKITEKESSIAKNTILSLVKNNPNVTLFAHRELESKVELVYNNTPYRITVVHKDLLSSPNQLISFIQKPHFYESDGITCRELWDEAEDDAKGKSETTQLVDIEHDIHEDLIWIGPRIYEYKQYDLFSLNPSFWEIEYKKN